MDCRPLPSTDFYYPLNLLSKKEGDKASLPILNLVTETVVMLHYDDDFTGCCFRKELYNKKS